MTDRVPRLVVAAPASGHGKTTVATGLMAALRARGLQVSGHKVGPDYIDPSYHALATGRPGRNLDPHLQGEERIAPLFLHGVRTPRPADLAIVEGALGLFDGALGRDGFASTAHVARLLDAPVLLVLDAGAAGRSVAATVHGFATFDPGVRIGGVLLNRLGSDRHEREVRDAVRRTGIPVLGALRRDPAIAVPSRHLGLVPAAERGGDALDVVQRLAAIVAAGVDLDAVQRLAGTAGPLTAEPWTPPAAPAAARTRIAVAGGRAFTFRYAETDELLSAAGAEPVEFDPAADEALPAGTAGLYLGGGFPEVHADDLAANAPMRAAIAAFAATGGPIVAECAGLLYLCREVDGRPMAGVLPAAAAMTDRLTLGYRTARDPVTGEPVTGHEFHRTRIEPEHGAEPAWLVDGSGPEGFTVGALHASYLHTHWAGRPGAAAAFVRQASRDLVR